MWQINQIYLKYTLRVRDRMKINLQHELPERISNSFSQVLYHFSHWFRSSSSSSSAYHMIPQTLALFFALCHKCTQPPHELIFFSLSFSPFFAHYELNMMRTRARVSMSYCTQNIIIFASFLFIETERMRNSWVLKVSSTCKLISKENVLLC